MTSFLKLTTFPSTMWNYVVLILEYLRCAFDTLLYNPCFFPMSLLTSDDIIIPKTPRPEQQIRITRYEPNTENEERCAVCLGDVEEGEEIGELRCSHVFHKLCLERWVRLKHMTCPLCRGSLAPPVISTTSTSTSPNSHEDQAEDDYELEVLFFNFCYFDSEDAERGSWWLR